MIRHSEFNPLGFDFYSYSSGIKQGAHLDLGLVISQSPCSYAGAFTTNKIKAAPVILCRKLLGKPINGIIVNSGNANACTGESGYRNAIGMAQLLEEKYSFPKNSVLPLSTGVIGVQLPLEKISRALTGEIDEIGAPSFAKAIMTTDTVPKQAGIEIELGSDRKIRIAGFAKGAGMIAPNMATMLAVILTDLQISAKNLQNALNLGLRESFNAITIDGDMSTNDSLIILANGNSNIRLRNRSDKKKFESGLFKVMESLAKQIVHDGEGATKFIEILIEQAKSVKQAELAGRAIANSLLVKTAFFGNDPNWGRIIDAIGYSGACFSLKKLSLYYHDRYLFKDGQPLKFDKTDLSEKLAKTREIKIKVSLGIGKHQRRIYTTDLSYDYVKINADYST